jgi:Holliday junction resolvase RusA-like endonuclease
VKIVLDGERPVSWNRYYSGTHWRKRSKMARDVHLIVRSEIYGRDIPDINNPVHITVVAYLKGQMIDADNICAKMYVDGLKGLVIEDDDPRCVRSVTTVSLKDNKNPRVEIHVNEIPDEAAGDLICIQF